MDIVQDWAGYLLGNHVGLPPYAGQVFSIASLIKSYLEPVIAQLSAKPDLATIALLLVIFFISLKLLNMLWQTVVFWVRLARTLVFWGGLVALGLWMYTRGPDGVAADINYWYETWNGEYQYWKEQENLARLVKPKPTGRGATRFF